MASYASLVQFVKPSIENGLVISWQLEIIAIVSRYQPSEVGKVAAPGSLTDELLQLNQFTGISKCELLEAALNAARCKESIHW